MHIIRFTQFFQLRIPKTALFLFLTNANLHIHFQKCFAFGGFQATSTCTGRSNAQTTYSYVTFCENTTFCPGPQIGDFVPLTLRRSRKPRDHNYGAKEGFKLQRDVQNCNCNMYHTGFSIRAPRWPPAQRPPESAMFP